MARLTWDPLANQNYELGVDRGVLYVGTAPGVVWNGLQSVQESYVGGDVTPMYVDGIKVRDIVSNKFYQATIKAYSAPKEFLPCIGQTKVRGGMYLTQQPHVKCGFTYRTMVGVDQYTIHMVWNAIAIKTGNSDISIGRNASPDLKTYKIVPSSMPTTTLPKLVGHLSVDSWRVAASKLTDLENWLYGTSNTDPQIPSQTFLYTILNG